MKELVVASGNKGKVAEFRQMLSKLDFNVTALDALQKIVEPEETGSTFMENAKLKAVYYAKETGKPCLADDSGLEVEALDGAPGVYSARYAGSDNDDKANNNLLLKNMLNQENRKCRFCCSLALADANGNIVLTAEGFCEGELLKEEVGQNGFGYDPLFYSVELKKSLGQATAEEKNVISHRSKALKKLVSLLALLEKEKCL